jgi:protein O-GlcNAc transferase
VEALNNKANLLHTLHRHHEALVCLEEAARLDPSDDKALGNLGYILTEYKRNAMAAAYFSKVLEINPYYDYAQGLRAYALLHCCDWRGYDEHRAAIREGISEGRRVCNPLAFMALSDEPPEQLLCAQIFARHRFPEEPKPIWQGEIYRHRKVRVAYVSPDFREHPVGHALCGVLEQHDHTRFELFGISLGVDDKSSLRKRYRQAFDHFIDARELRSAELAQWVRSMEIDVMVDLAGYTSGSRADMFAMRPAPIQVSYLGFPGTLGAPYMDYILADKVVIPDENRPYYQEQVVWLPHAYFPADNTVGIAEETPSRKDCGLPDEGFVFCSFNHDYKINPPVFAVWMRLLKAVPGSVLWLMKLNEDAQSHLLSEADAAGVNPERIIFATRVPRIEDHLARYRQANLFLDTHPYNAHTTANDAIRAGLPLLTRLGGSFPSRVASSLLTTLGVPELIANSLEDYENKALHFATNPEALESIAQKMRDQLPGNPLFDSLRQARALETAYQVMASRYQQGLGPGPIEVRG